MTGTPEIRDESAAPSVPSSSSLPEQLERQFGACELVRPFRRSAYDPGNLLEYPITGVVPANSGRMVVEVDRFVGGGFAGQVYRVNLLEAQAGHGPISGLVVGQPYALKILKPPSTFARVFRDFLYFLAYQGRFSAQVNPASVRVGVLWQKLIRRAAAVEFGSDGVVCDTYATFYDEHLFTASARSTSGSTDAPGSTRWTIACSTAGISEVFRPKITTARSTCTRSSSCGSWSICCTRWARPNWPASTNGGRARASPTR